MSEQPIHGMLFQPMLWFEPDPQKKPDQILSEGMAFYTTKYGQKPTLARVHLSWPEMNGDQPEGLRIERVRYILPRNVLLSAERPPSGETP